MTRVIFVTPETFRMLAQASEGPRYVEVELNDAGYRNLVMDSFGDWAAVVGTASHPAGTCQTKADLLAESGR